MRADPKKHNFDPTYPGSTACKWCAFNAKAHRDYKPKKNA